MNLWFAICSVFLCLSVAVGSALYEGLGPDSPTRQTTKPLAIETVKVESAPKENPDSFTGGEIFATEIDGGLVDVILRKDQLKDVHLQQGDVVRIGWGVDKPSRFIEKLSGGEKK